MESLSLEDEELDPEDDEQSQPRAGDPGRNFRVFCDESGMHDSRRMVGFGSFWIPTERRGDLQSIRRRTSSRHFPPSEVKWTKVKKQTLPFFLDIVDEFFQRPWMMFHCIVISKEDFELSHHNNDLDLAHRKFFTMLLSSKIRRFAAPGKTYSIRVDPIQSYYKKADEAAEKVLQNLVEQVPPLRGANVVRSLRTVDSRTTFGVQMSDLLLGAVMAARANNTKSEAKAQVMARIASHLRWPDLTSCTYGGAWKFNIWRFWDPQSRSPRPERGRATPFDRPNRQRGR